MSLSQDDKRFNMSKKKIRIGTRESQLALWQADHVKYLLSQQGVEAELVKIKSEGDLDLITPLYAIGVQGIFTRSLDQALLNDQIDIAVHSMKDVPVRLPPGLAAAAVLKRDSPFDLFVPHSSNKSISLDNHPPSTIASSSLRRKAQWLHRFPEDRIESIRGNVNTRLKKLDAGNWWGAIFAAAGLERIGLRPANAIELDWMVPAPAQGAILVVCREKEEDLLTQCQKLHHRSTAFCVQIERDFLATLLGGCSTPIGALAEISGEEIFFRGNLLDASGEKMFSVEKKISLELAATLGVSAAHELLRSGGNEILEEKQHA
jgi:hydroxymethylbilane synthase